MKKHCYFLLLILIIPFLNSCKKEKLLKPSDEYIEAQLGNEFVRYVGTNGNPFNNTYYNDSIGEFLQDQLNLLRQSDDGNRSLEIYILQAELNKNNVPIHLPHKTSCSVELQWRDYSADVDVNFGASDDYNYTGQVQLTIESWDDDNFLEGNFAGTISTRTGKVREVSKGKFRIQIFD